MTLEELFTHAENVQSLLVHPGFLLLSSLVESETAELDRYLDGDRDDISHVTYARKHGRKGGLLRTLDLAHELLDYATRRKAEQQAKHEGSGETEPVRS